MGARERKGKEGKGKERKGKEGKGRKRKGKEGKGRERKGKDGKGRKKEGKGRERKGKEGKETFLGSPCFDVCNVFAFFLFPVFVFVWVGNNGSSVKIGCVVVAEAAWV